MVLCSAFSPGMPAVISTPPASRSAFSSCSYWPRKRNPCERTVAFLLPILAPSQDRKSTRLNSSHGYISYAVFCLKKKKKQLQTDLLNPLHAFKDDQRTTQERLRH